MFGAVETMSVSFFYGDEEFLMEREINSLREKLLDKNFSAMNYKYIKNPNYQDFISFLMTQPMMFGAQMIVIDIENFFGNITFEDYQINEIKAALENISPSLHIILTLVFERNSKRKPDSRKKIYKVISSCAKMQEFATIPLYKTDDFVNFVNKEGKKQGITFEKPAALKLIEQVGNNLRELSKETEKLVLIAYPKNKITEQMVKDICITNDDLLSLTDKLLVGKKASALKEFRKLCDKQFPLILLSAIQTNLRRAIIIKLNEKILPTSEIAKMTGFTDFLVQLQQKKLKSADLKELVKLKRNFAKAEYNIKSGKALDVQAEIELAFY